MKLFPNKPVRMIFQNVLLSFRNLYKYYMITVFGYVDEQIENKFII